MKLTEEEMKRAWEKLAKVGITIDENPISCEPFPCVKRSIVLGNYTYIIDENGATWCVSNEIVDGTQILKKESE